jgi:surface protein
MLSTISNFSGPLSSISSGGIRPFISTWRTTTGKETIILPLLGSYNLVVNWGDGVTEIVTDNLGDIRLDNRQHTYKTAGDYTITISGNMDGWSFRKFDSSVVKIISISQWGCLKIDNYGSQFINCSNLTLTNVSDILDLTRITNLNGIFNNCTSLISINRIDEWNVSDVTNMDGMFYNATSFNSDINNWNVSNVTAISNFMSNKNYSYYDNLLNAWSQLTLKSIDSKGNQIVLDMGNIQYTSSGEAARQSIIDTYGWVIKDGGKLTLPFISTWRTTTRKETIILPLDGSYNLVVNWGDEVTEKVTNILGTPRHTYETDGDYIITISGTMDRWTFGKVPDSASKIISISQWGCLKIDSGRQFINCSNLTLTNVSDILDLTGITGLYNMFDGCSSLTTINRINEWDVSSVTSMNGMFQNSTLFNSDISNWNVSWVSVMENMFTNATSFNRDISNWNISNVSYMSVFMVGKSTANYSYYDNLLNSWSKLRLRSITPKGGQIVLDMGNIQYTSVGQVARQSIIDTYGWSIKDGGMI